MIYADINTDRPPLFFPPLFSFLFFHLRAGTKTLATVGWITKKGGRNPRKDAISPRYDGPRILVRCVG